MTDSDIDVGQIASGADKAVIAHDRLRDALKATSIELNAHEDGVRVRAYFEGFQNAGYAYDKLSQVTAAFKTAGSDVKGAVHYGGLEDSDDDRPAAIADALFFAPEEESDGSDDGSAFETNATLNVDVEVGDVEQAREAARKEADRVLRNIEGQIAEQGGAP